MVGYSLPPYPSAKGWAPFPQAWAEGCHSVALRSCMISEVPRTGNQMAEQVPRPAAAGQVMCLGITDSCLGISGAFFSLSVPSPPGIKHWLEPMRDLQLDPPVSDPHFLSLQLPQGQHLAGTKRFWKALFGRYHRLIMLNMLCGMWPTVRWSPTELGDIFPLGWFSLETTVGPPKGSRVCLHRLILLTIFALLDRTNDNCQQII